MIKLQDLTPEVYYKQSRDFQFIGRLYDIVLNSVKTNIDLLYSLPLSDNSDRQLIDLMSLTLGFKPRREYNHNQLTAVCNILPTIFRNKGTIKAVELVVKAISRAEGNLDKIYVGIEEDNRYSLLINLNDDKTDIALVEDLLDYILPAGMIYNIIIGKQQSENTRTPLMHESIAQDYSVDDQETSVVFKGTVTDILEKAKPGFMINTTVIRPLNNEAEGD